jgi:hypothetical protein
MTMGKAERVAIKLVKLVVFAGIFVGFCFGVRELWNWLIPDIFGFKSITVWQALGLLLLSRILFGGFRGWPGHHRRSWKRHMQKRWSRMTPEEREKFRQGWKRRCSNFGPGQAESPL